MKDICKRDLLWEKLFSTHYRLGTLMMNIIDITITRSRILRAILSTTDVISESVRMKVIELFSARDGNKYSWEKNFRENWKTAIKHTHSA